MTAMQRHFPIIILLAASLGCTLLPNMPDLAIAQPENIAVPLPSDHGSPPDSTTPTLATEAGERLPTDWVWVGVEGFSSAVLAVSPNGQTRVVSLPLNDNQTTSDVIASQDGRTLIYLVWEDDQQLGVAVWNLAERDARLIVTVGESERLIYLSLRDDGAQLAYVKVLSADAVLTTDTAWVVESMPVAGGDITSLLDSETLPNIFPPRPFAWPVGDDLYLNAVDPQGRSQGVFAVNPIADSSRVIKEANIDEVLIAPILNPQRTQIAYLSYESERLQNELQDITPTNVIRVVNVDTGEIVERFAPGDDEAVLGVQWATPDSLLADVAVLSADEGPNQAGIWATASFNQARPWRRYGPGPDHEFIFDFMPFSEGVAYTTLSIDDDWTLVLLPELSDDDFEQISLKPLQQRLGAPVIIYTPQ